MYSLRQTFENFHSYELIILDHRTDGEICKLQLKNLHTKYMQKFMKLQYLRYLLFNSCSSFISMKYLPLDINAVNTLYKFYHFRRCSVTELGFEGKCIGKLNVLIYNLIVFVCCRLKCYNYGNCFGILQ